MTDMDLGQMYLVYNKALVARSSSSIVFFKKEYVIAPGMEGKTTWNQYKILDHRGFLSFNKGNIRIQITTAEKIYFYLIDKETFMPDLENLMLNYLGCT